MSIPRSTYRLQIREDFDLHAATELVDYLHDLGVDWIYLSPLLGAVPGSDHGYDVVDHRVIDEARGGPDGLTALSAAARDAGMGVLVDIVPNHVGVGAPVENGWWWDLLRNGRASRYAEAFDVDWEVGGGRLSLPVLGDDGLAALTVEEPTSIGAARELRYHDLRLPIADDTGDGSPEEIHARQAYELVHWTRAGAELNYRRFFAVNELAGIRVEIPWVFEESHAEIWRWFDEGIVDGLRVDHPDGLLDPGGYLDDLARLTGSAYVLVEKILEGDERLPAHWQTAGTTGYDALADLDRILVDPRGAAPLDRLQEGLAGERVVWADLIHDTKRGIADSILRSEILRITRLLPAGERVDDAVAELAACFPVYRSYLPYGAEHLAAAADDAARRRPDLAQTLRWIVPLLADALSLIHI